MPKFLKGKSFNVKVVDDPPHSPPPDSINYEKLVETVAKNAVVLMAAYFTCHTISQVIILNAMGVQK